MTRLRNASSASDDDNEMISIGDFARGLYVSPSTIRRRVDKGDIKSHRVGERKVVIPRAEYVRARREAGLE